MEVIVLRISFFCMALSVFIVGKVCEVFGAEFRWLNFTIYLLLIIGIINWAFITYIYKEDNENYMILFNKTKRKK